MDRSEVVTSLPFNDVEISGIVEESFELSHETAWGKYYKSRVKVVRLSGTVDFVPIIIPKLLRTKLPFPKGSEKGQVIVAKGTFRSHNWQDENGFYHLEVFMYANSIEVYPDKSLVADMNQNYICLEGIICKEPVYRITPFGRRITDLKLAVKVKPSSEQVAYIPCIAWGWLAEYTSDMVIGDKVKVVGRIQSRDYFKRFPKRQLMELDESVCESHGPVYDAEGNVLNGVVKTVYEVSISELELVDGE